LYSLVWQKCSPLARTSIKAHFNYKMTTEEWISTVISKGRELKLSWPTIGYLVGKTADAVRMFYKRKADVEDLGEPVKKGKSNKYTFIKRAMNEIIHETPSVTVRGLQNELEAKFGDEIEIPKTTTIHKLMKELNYESVTPETYNYISEVNVQKRLDFATKYLEKDDGFWSRVIWSDETMVKRVGKESKHLIWVSKNDPKYLRPHFQTLQQGGFGVMFWGCFTMFGFGPLIVVEGNIDSKKYIKVIKDALLPFMADLDDEHGVEFMFMQDNAPSHKSNATIEFLESKDIELLPWPPQSADLNPFENLWAILKKRRAKKFGMPHSKEELIRQVMDVWDDLEPDLAYILASSAYGRLSLCKQRKGRHTGY
jgi:transposase